MIASSRCCIAGLMGKVPACHENRPSWKGMNHLPTIDFHGLRDSGRESCRYTCVYIVNCTFIAVILYMISLHLFRKVSATNVRYFKTRLPDLGKRIPGKRTLPPAEGTSMWNNDSTMQFWSKWNFWKPYKPPQLPEDCVLCPQGQLHAARPRTLAGSLRAWEVLRNEQPISRRHLHNERPHAVRWKKVTMWYLNHTCIYEKDKAKGSIQPQNTNAVQDCI